VFLGTYVVTALSGWARRENVLLLKSSPISIQCWDDTFGNPQWTHIQDTLRCSRKLKACGPLFEQAAWYHTSHPLHWMLLIFRPTFFLQIPHGYLGPGLMSMSPDWVRSRYISVQVLTSFLSDKRNCPLQHFKVKLNNCKLQWTRPFRVSIEINVGCLFKTKVWRKRTVYTV